MSIKSICAIFLIPILFSCTTIQDTIFIQDVEVNSPIHHPPIHITDTSKYSIILSPKFSVSTTSLVSGTIKGHTKVNDLGFFQIDTTVNSDGSITFREALGANKNIYRGNNLIWNITKVMAGIDMDARISDRSAFFGGINFTSQNNSTYLGGTIGFGLFEAGKNYGYRLDGGIYWQTIFFDAQTIVARQITNPSSTDNYLLLYHDKQNSTHIDPFFSITYNTAYDNWLVNFVINAGYFRQTLIDFEPQSEIDRQYPFAINKLTDDTRGAFSTNFVHFMPGVFFQFGSSGRIIMGTNFYFDTDSEDITKTPIIIPYVQVDFRL